MAILPEDFSGHALRVSGEVTAHGTVRSIVGLNHVAFAGSRSDAQGGGESGCGQIINMLNDLIKANWCLLRRNNT
jgi:hypothetical protein